MRQARTEARAEAEAAAKERYATALPHVCAELDKLVVLMRRLIPLPLPVSIKDIGDRLRTRPPYMPTMWQHGPCSGDELEVETSRKEGRGITLD